MYILSQKEVLTLQQSLKPKKEFVDLNNFTDTTLQ